MLSGRLLYKFALKEPAIGRIICERNGCPEILWLQSMGIMDPFLSFGHQPEWTKYQPRGLCHVTLTDTCGKMIWETGCRFTEGYPYFSHFTDGMMTVDCDDNRQLRLLVCGTQDGQGVLRFFDLNTGHLLNSVSLPRPDYVWVLSGRSDLSHGGRMIVLTTQDVGYYASGYGRHSALFLDARGLIVKEVEVNGDGHFPACFDADGDGFDEYQLGYDLFDHDASHIWRADYWQNRPLHGMTQHSDQVHIYKTAGDKVWSAIIAGSDALYRIDSSGQTLWRKSWNKWGRRFRYLPWPVSLHVQFFCVGRFLPDDKNDYIFVLHCRDRMSLLNMRGKVLWQGLLPENWPGGKPSCMINGEVHMGTPMIRWTNPLGTGQDLLVYNEAGWPYVINGLGQRIVDFPWPEDACQLNEFKIPGLPETEFKPPHRPDDWGYGYRCLVSDINNDGREEVLIYDRRFCWVYVLDEIKKD